MKKYLALKASVRKWWTFALTVMIHIITVIGAKPNEILTLTFTK